MTEKAEKKSSTDHRSARAARAITGPETLHDKNAGKHGIGVTAQPYVNEAESQRPEQPYINEAQKRGMPAPVTTRDNVRKKREAVSTKSQLTQTGDLDGDDEPLKDQNTQITADDDWDAPKQGQKISR